ncbi:MAG: hypothetical protein CM15mP109_15300 [Candidatus Dadabacteria bacterium]|nr:MAG: hypothetical protein CM15mP109_15300 [Candidatus Dadabacteria bacterium]
MFKLFSSSFKWRISNTGWISSDPHGMFDVVNKCVWSEVKFLDQLEIDESRLPKIINREP